MQQRYYEPGIGRFLSVDPVTADGKTGANFNRYKYASNNPYKFVDPDGRVDDDPNHRSGPTPATRPPPRDTRSVTFKSPGSAGQMATTARTGGARGATPGGATSDSQKAKAHLYFTKPHLTNTVEAAAAYGGGVRGKYDLDTNKASAGIVLIGGGERVAGIPQPGKRLGLSAVEMAGGLRWGDGGGAPVKIEGNWDVGPVSMSHEFDPKGQI